MVSIFSILLVFLIRAIYIDMRDEFRANQFNRYYITPKARKTDIKKSKTVNNPEPRKIVRKFLQIDHEQKIRNALNNPGSPFHEWEFELLHVPKFAPWEDVVEGKIIQNSNFKVKIKSRHTDIDLPEVVNLFDDNAYDIECVLDQHKCEEEKLIFVYVKTKRNMLVRVGNKWVRTEYKMDGALSICPKCRKQIQFNWVGMN